MATDFFLHNDLILHEEWPRNHKDLIDQSNNVPTATKMHRKFNQVKEIRWVKGRRSSKPFAISPIEIVSFGSFKI